MQLLNITLEGQQLDYPLNSNISKLRPGITFL